MRIISYQRQGRESFGLLTDAGVVDAAARLPQFGSLRAVLTAGALDALRALESEPADCAAGDITWLPVIPDAGKILCVGVNYLLHMQEAKREPPAIPWIFLRTNDSMTGHGLPLMRPRGATTFDWEVELGAIIGTPGRYITRADALNHVAGYTVFNDGSIREYQKHSPLWSAGKNCHRSGSMGPWMVPRAEFADAFDNRMYTRLNGEVMQDEKVNAWHFDLPAVIEYCSSWASLEPGDVIAMGTPHGVGFARRPPVFMQPGDVVEVEIEGLGVLRNPIIAE